MPSRTSMRPAHCAREVLAARRAPQTPQGYFNEARALCAGSWSHDHRAGRHDGTSMRPAHCAREVWPKAGRDHRRPQTSMRPAHCARASLKYPEGQQAMEAVHPTSRAQCAGLIEVKRHPLQVVEVVKTSRAQCAGLIEVCGVTLRVLLLSRTSRAQCAGSFDYFNYLKRVPLDFNEARALCAGSSRK